MDNRAGEMQVFLRVVEAGSFSEAARLLRMTPSTVSKLISRIEARLGIRLVERSTRRLSLTAEGLIYYERSQTLLEELDKVERELSQGAATTGGMVRVNVSVAFGALGLEPLLPEFWRTYPNVVVDLSLSDEIVDLYLDRTDIAFRVGPLPDSGMTARRIGVARRKIVASPAYLERYGTPRSPDDLSRHNCLGFNFRRSAPVWPMKESGRIVDRAVKARCSPTMARRCGGWRSPASGSRAWATTMYGLILPAVVLWRCSPTRSSQTKRRFTQSFLEERGCLNGCAFSSISSCRASSTSSAQTLRRPGRQHMMMLEGDRGIFHADRCHRRA